METHHLLWVNQLYMAMFNSYVSLPEGKPLKKTSFFGVTGVTLQDDEVQRIHHVAIQRTHGEPSPIYS